MLSIYIKMNIKDKIKKNSDFKCRNNVTFRIKN